MILNGHTPGILLTRACPPTIVLIEFAKLEVKLSLSLHFHMHMFCFHPRVYTQHNTMLQHAPDTYDSCCDLPIP